MLKNLVAVIFKGDSSVVFFEIIWTLFITHSGVYVYVCIVKVATTSTNV